MEALTAGHRIRPTARGVVVDAWGPSRAQCFTKLVHGFVATFADVSWAETAEPASLHVDADDDERLLAALVDEMLCLLHVLGVVPVDGAILQTEDGGLAGCFNVAAVGHVGLVGPLPRAVVNHQVERGSDDASWRCQVTVKKQVTLPP